MAVDDIPRRLLRRVEITGAVAFVTHSQEEPYSETPEHEHEFAYVWLVASGDYSEWIRGYGERKYEPFRWSYHPAGERHVHKVGAVPPVGVGVVMTVAPEGTRIPERPAVLVGPQYVDQGFRLHRALMHAPDDRLTIESIWSEMLAALAEQAPERADSPPPWLMRVGAILQDDFASDHSLESLAREVAIHPVHLATMFKRFAGVSLGESLREIRLERACVMLCRTERPIGEIARECGFYDNAHLTHLFKRAMKQTPQQYRQGYRS